MSDPLHCRNCGQTYYNDEGHRCPPESLAPGQIGIIPSSDFVPPIMAVDKFTPDRYLRLPNEHLLWDYLDEYLNANGATPQVVGIDHTETPFLAWLDEEGGDCLGLRVVRLLLDDGGVTSSLSAIEIPAQGCTSELTYPVQIMSRLPID